MASPWFLWMLFFFDSERPEVKAVIHSHDPNVVLASMLYKGNEFKIKNQHMIKVSFFNPLSPSLLAIQISFQYQVALFVFLKTGHFQQRWRETWLLWWRTCCSNRGKRSRRLHALRFSGSSHSWLSTSQCCHFEASWHPHLGQKLATM